MSSDRRFAFRYARCGYIALAICFLELVIVWGGILVFHQGGRTIAPVWAQDAFVLAYFAGFCSLPVSIVGLFLDRFRLVAFVALLFGIVNVAVCVAPIAV